MIKLLGLLLAITLHTSSSLRPHVLGKRELSLPTVSDTDRELISDPSISQGNLWLQGDGQIRYFKDSLKNTNEHLRSRLLSSLIDDSEGLVKTQRPEILSSQQLQPQDSLPHGQREGYEELGEKEEREGQRELGIQEEYDEQHREEHGVQKENGHENDEEEYRKRYEEKNQNQEVHLFGPPEVQLRGNLEQFQHQKPRIVQLGAHNLQKMRQDRLDAKITDDNPRISRVERPAITHFSYIHPEKWSLDNPECSGSLQSPVNFDSDKLVALEVPSRLIWTGYWNQPESMTITDNGHSVELSGTWDEKKAPFISGGPLVGDYLFAQLHFHWGPKDSVGSEHTINNKSFPMEMHMVHYKRDYGSLSEALKHDDGLAVVAFLFEISETVNFGINFLADSLNQIQNKPRARISVKPYPLAFLHFIFQEDYASYVGSLTTPPCREIVTWLVSSSPLTISRKQLESFRKISNKWPEKENYRPRQALNGRRLYYVAQ